MSRVAIVLGMGLLRTGLGGLALLASCSRPNASTDASAGDAAAPLVLHRPTTTSPSIVLRNLDSEIADRERRMVQGTVDSDPELVARYLTRARFEGRVSDLIAADDASARGVAARPHEARAHLARASALSAIHRFSDAMHELDAAAPTDAAEVQAATHERGIILLATGREDEAANVLTIVDGALSEDLAVRAGLEARLGHAAEAERLFDLARTRYRDVSPIAWSWMDFERARALEMAGDRRSARSYLEEAVAVLPGYAHAVVHLSALEPPDVALAQLQDLARTSDDPDVLAAQADALRRAGRADEARAMAARAAARYAEVLARLPLAYADHAAAFYLGMGGDAPRALDLAKQNADNRPTDEAVELWLTAAQATGSPGAVCAAAAKVLTRPHAPASLRDRATSASKGCR